MIRRLGIFIFYDGDGIVDAYVKVLLSSLCDFLEELVIVVNGDIDCNSEKCLREYSSRIFWRENLGYDGGAYKDVFLHYLKDEKWEKWDEVVLFNDTFYAPIFPWNPVFDRMQNQMCDFWGITRHLGGGKVISLGVDIEEHIQGYFLVCRKTLLGSPIFWEFWEQLNYPQSYEEAIVNFEINFTVFFSQNGFVGKTFTDLNNDKIKIQYGENVYAEKSYELIKNIQLPLVKRKAFSLVYFENIYKTVEYIKSNSKYDIGLIDKHLQRMCRSKRVTPYNPLELEEFYNTHKRIFIYGNGKYGVNMAKYFEYRKWHYEGFIVSSLTGDFVKENVYQRDLVEFMPTDGVILALGRSNFEEVYKTIKYRVGENQLFLPQF